jgi:hypothetical protein
MTVTRRIRSPGRARNKPLKPLRAGMPGDSGGPVVNMLVCFVLFCTRGYGCIGHPAFPTPSVVLEGRTLRKIRAHAPRDREAVPAHGGCLNIESGIYARRRVAPNFGLNALSTLFSSRGVTPPRPQALCKVAAASSLPAYDAVSMRVARDDRDAARQSRG